MDNFLPTQGNRSDQTKTGECKNRRTADDENKEEPVSGTFPLRSDVQSLGIGSSSEPFDPTRVLVLADVSDVTAGLFHFFFLHSEAVANFFSVGLPFSKVSISLFKDEILIQEITRETWEKVWVFYDTGALRPFLFLRENNEIPEAESSSLEADVIRLNEEEALSTFGISCGPSDTFIRVDGATPTRQEPSWKVWMRCFLDHILPRSAATDGLQDNSRVLSSKLKAKLEEQSKEKGLIVKVIFISPKSCFFEGSANRETEMEIHENQIDFLEKSQIRPTLTIHFFRTSGLKSFKLTLDVEYDMGNEGPISLAEWYQNDFQLSLRHVGDDSSLYQETSRVVSEMEWIETERLKFQTRLKVLKKHSFFVVSDHSVGNNLNFVADFWPAQNPSLYFHLNPGKEAKETGLWSLFDITLEGIWDVFGTETHEYVMEASKRLSIENDADDQKKVLQVFRSKFNLNYHFDEFLHRYSKPPYHWRLINEASQHSVSDVLQGVRRSQ